MSIRHTAFASFLPVLLILLIAAAPSRAGIMQSAFKSGDNLSVEAESVMLGALVVIALALLFLVILVTAGTWKLFEKAGQPGWAALIPVYSWLVLLRVVRKPGWWILLMFIPFMNIGVFIVINIDLARAFGMEEIFAVGLILMPYVFYPILGFGDARYSGTTEEPSATGYDGSGWQT